MFSNNRSRDDRSGTSPAPLTQSGGASKRGMFSVIGPDIVITGSIRATSELHIEGRVEGDVDCSTLVQGADSQIFGSVTVESARVAGAIEGTVRAKLLTVERTARITGDVEYETITIENGGHVDGRLKHMSAITAAPLRAEPVQSVSDQPITIASIIGSD
ncbi:polymer-forming cytoskeletal protein [Sphingomonas sp.]|jgi:cytoskeletal protein CcmA (bactofilin family)|uniref:bactofilin family protein n=1 Tax=Sphingomonas sp. TaxID=28214 RepID=UPI002E0DE455|nr:polymer-forming cytoskeletal protein [Sphingomonas sp.]